MAKLHPVSTADMVKYDPFPYIVGSNLRGKHTSDKWF